jgi:hypothetical protein
MPASEVVEEMAAIDEFTPIAGTGEIEGHRARAAEMELSPPSDFIERELPLTLPPFSPPGSGGTPISTVSPASAFETFSHEHEFEPEMEPHVAGGAPAEVAGPGVAAGLVGFASAESSGAPSPTLPSAEVAVPVDMVQQIAQRVISQVSERVIHQIAWDVIPGLAEKLIRAEIERIKARAESEHD